MRIDEIISIIEVAAEQRRLSNREIREKALLVYRSLYRQRSWPLLPSAIVWEDRILPIAYTRALPDLAVALIAGSAYPAYNETKGYFGFPFPHIIVIPYKHEIPKQRDFRTARALAAKLFPNTVDGLLGQLSGNLPIWVHEFTHYWDARRAGGLVQSTGYREDSDKDVADAGYWNDQMERNAFFNQVAMLVDQANQQYIHQPFRVFLTSILKEFDPEMLPALTVENRKRLYNRLYQLWQSRQ